MSTAVGKITQVMGPVIDAEFPPGHLPNIQSALTITNPAISDAEGNLVVEVASHLGENTVRCIAMDATEGLSRGMDVVDTGAPIAMPVGREVLGRIVNVIGEPVDSLGPSARAARRPSTASRPSSPTRAPRCRCSRRASRSSTS